MKRGNSPQPCGIPVPTSRPPHYAVRQPSFDGGLIYNDEPIAPDDPWAYALAIGNYTARRHLRKMRVHAVVVRGRLGWHICVRDGCTRTGDSVTQG